MRTNWPNPKCPNQSWILFQIDYLRVPPTGPEEVQVVCQGVQTGGYGWGRVGAFAVTSDGSRLGFAIMDDAGELRTGTRAGNGAWILKTASVPDAKIDWVTPYLDCGFSPQGGFWILHTEVVHPPAANVDRYFELLEEVLP